MEDFITEKFALLNLITALNNALKTNAVSHEQKTDAPPPPPEAKQDQLNAMAILLEKHERISNRVKNTK